MAQPLKRADYEKVYRDTEYFIGAIINEYAYYGDFVNAVKSGGAEFAVKRKKIQKHIDDSWITAIEDCLVALDNCIRNPAKYIEEREEVLPIELSHNITSRSLRHLAQHTDYINKIEDGVITPSKILNVFNEETLLTYENKFLNTLIQRLYVFVSRRYTQLCENGDSTDCISMDFSSTFDFAGSKGKINFNVEVEEPNDVKEGVSVSERVKRLNEVTIRYLNSDFARAMGKNYIRPPIMRTNAITKNKDLHQCLILWQFIESYDKIGYEITAEESAEKPDGKYIEGLYSTLALQYMLFRYNITENMGNENEVLDRTESGVLEPVFKMELSDLENEDYNVYDTEYRRVVPVSSLSSRKLSEEELRIRAAVDTALAADRQLLARKRAEERERQRLEEERIAKEKKIEQARIAEKEREKQRLDEIRRRREKKRELAIAKQKKRRAEAKSKKARKDS